MEGYRSIAVCVDGTVDPPPGVTEARGLLRPGGTLRLVHVARRVPLVAAGASVPWAGAADPVAAAEDWLAGAASGARAEPVVLVDDDASAAVSGWCAEAGVGLLVAVPRRSRLERAVLGNFTRDLAHGAPCPVLLTRGAAAPSGRGAGLGTVAAVVDEGSAAVRVVHAARAAGNGRLVLVHAMTPDLLSRLTGAGDPEPPGWLLELAEAEDADEVVLVEGGAGDVAEWAAMAGAGLLVAAARNAPGPARLGSFTDRLSVAAPCPVLVARAPVAA